MDVMSTSRIRSPDIKHFSYIEYGQEFIIAIWDKASREVDDIPKSAGL